MKTEYLVIGREEVFYNSNNLIDCKNFIDRTIKQHPEHIDLEIYKKVVTNDADLSDEVINDKPIYNGW